MDRFYGFDLGDAESAVARLEGDGQTEPEMLAVRGRKSFITAYARLRNGDLLIGENACYDPDAAVRKLRFKSRYLTDPESAKDIRAFAAGVLGELYTTGDLIKNSDSSFYIGCPAGWDKAARERYREIFEGLGYPPCRIVSESRAALIAACQSKHLQVGYDITSKPVLVVDIGSSTTDFAYIMSGREVELQTAGEVSLGGGVMDEILLEESVAASPRARQIRQVFEQSEPWRSYCEFAARRLKEKYFSDEDYWSKNDCTETVLIRYRLPLRLTLRMDAETAEHLTGRKTDRLGGRSFRDVFLASLQEVRSRISGAAPELVFLTGGVSKLPAVRQWCGSVFPEAVVITGAEPEYAVARGLAWSGRIDRDLKAFRAEVHNLVETTAVETIVQKNITDLYRRTADVLVDPILRNAGIPVFQRWRSGEIRRLSDIDGALQTEIRNYLQTDEARELLVRPVTAWLKPVAAELEEKTIPICIRYRVPYRALSLSSYLAASDIDVQVDAKDMFAVEEITILVDAIVSVIVGLLCGGSGVALISSGPAGVVAGVMISFIVLLLGKNWIQKAALNADIPLPVRKMIPKNYFASRIDRISEEVKANLTRNLEEEKDTEIQEHLVREITAQIEHCLTKMAEVVEIPLGG